MSYAQSYCNYVRKGTNRSAHLQHGYVGKKKPVPSPQYVSVGKTSTTQTMSYEMSSSMGYRDPDIRREVLGTRNILQTPVNDVIALVENKEMARNAVSSFKRQQVPPKEPPLASLSRVDQTKQAACPDCQRLFTIFTEGTRGWNTKPHTVCLNCYRVRRRRKRTPHTPPHPPPTSQTVESGPISQVASFHSGSARRRCRRKHAKVASVDSHQ